GAGDAQREVLLGGFDAPGGKLHVLAAQGVFHVGGGQAEGGQLLPVEPDAHGRVAAAAHLNAGDAAGGAEPVHQIALGVVRQFKQAVAVAGEVQVHDGLSVGVHLVDFWRVRVFGQVVEHAVDAVAHVVGGVVDIAGDVEFNGDVGAAVAAAGGDGLDPLHARNLALDHLGDAALDHGGGRAPVVGVHRHDGNVDVGIFAQRQLRERNDAERHDKQAQHRREHRAADRKIRKAHGDQLLVVSASATCCGAALADLSSFTGEPSRSLTVP